MIYRSQYKDGRHLGEETIKTKDCVNTSITLEQMNNTTTVHLKSNRFNIYVDAITRGY